MDRKNDQDFHFFTELPAELRLMVWRFCLPHRVVELDRPFGEYSYSSPCGEGATCDLNKCPPVITRVCRESRSVACESARYVKLEAHPCPDLGMDFPLNKSLWIDYSRDSVHMSWRPPLELDDIHNRPGSPLDYLACKASEVQGGSFRFVYLGEGRESRRRDIELCKTMGPLDKLQQTPWGAVIMRVIVVHTTREHVAKTGLFELLCDAPIQVVGVDDEKRLDAFYDLARECEPFSKSILPRQSFHRASADSLRTTLKNRLLEITSEPERQPEHDQSDDSWSDDSWSDDYPSSGNRPDEDQAEDQAEEKRTPPSLHPAIMFRFCPKMCNHSRPSFLEAEAMVKNSNVKKGRPPMSKGRHNYQSFMASLNTRIWTTRRTTSLRIGKITAVTKCANDHLGSHYTSITTSSNALSN
jgi:PII-like signaling protein